jgi:hypothetical protein
MLDERSRARRRKKVLLLLVLVAFINLPLLHATWTDWRVARSGVDVTAQVTGHDVLGDDGDPRYWIGFVFPEDIDPDGSRWTAEVDRATYDAAVESEQVEVRVLEGRPSAYEVEGQVRHWAGLVTTLVADAVLLAVVLLVRRFGRRAVPPPVRMSAVGDLEPSPPGAVMEQLDGTLYLVRGEVADSDPDEVVLDVGAQEVVVILDGHRNPVALRESAQVRARLLE